MNRVNVEITAFIEAPNVDEAMGWEYGTALGKLCMIWGFSQSKALVEATALDICRWGRVRGPDCQARFLEALKDAGFVTARAEDQFEIHGNDTQLKNLAKKNAGRVKGGEATRQRWEKIRSQTTTDPEDSSSLGSSQAAASSPASPIQDNTKQYKTEQYKNGEDEEKDACAEPESSGPTPPATKPLSEFENPPDVAEALVSRRVSLDAQRAWLNAYPDALWIKKEIQKAIAWEKVNPSRKKRHFARFMGRWLSRGWDQRRPGQSAAHSANRAEQRSQGNLATLDAYRSRLGGQTP